jgi:hypothetical protein
LALISGDLTKIAIPMTEDSQNWKEMMSMPDALSTEISLIALLLFKFQVYSTFLHHYYNRPITLSMFRLLHQSTIHHMASINALQLPLKKFFCPQD